MNCRANLIYYFYKTRRGLAPEDVHGCGAVVLRAVRPEGGNAVKGLYQVFEDLVWLTQLGLNMLIPLVLCLGGCWWAVNNWNWPLWLYLPAILLGLASGAQNFWLFAKARIRRSQRKPEDRMGFNAHQ